MCIVRFLSRLLLPFDLGKWMTFMSTAGWLRDSVGYGLMCVCEC